MTKNEHTRSFSRPNLDKREKNKTTLFMLPALNLSMEKTSFELLRYFGFVNCFIDHKQGFIKPPDAVYVVFNPSTEALKDFSKFFELYKTYPTFVDDYIVDQNLIVVVFKVKEKWRATYREFKQSRYSAMSKEYAELFKRPDAATGKTHIATEYFIIHRHKDYRVYLEEKLGLDTIHIEESAELMDPLNMAKEIFDYEPAGNTTRDTEVQSRESECEAG